VHAVQAEHVAGAGGRRLCEYEEGGRGRGAQRRVVGEEAVCGRRIVEAEKSAGADGQSGEEGKVGGERRDGSEYCRYDVRMNIEY